MSKPKAKPIPYLFAVRDPPRVERSRHCALMALVFWNFFGIHRPRFHGPSFWPAVSWIFWAPSGSEGCFGRIPRLRHIVAGV
jgi:hypothetical protein